MKKSIIGLFTSVLVFVLGATLFGQTEPKFDLIPESETSVPGAHITLQLAVELEPTWYMYAITQVPPPHATRVALVGNEIFQPNGSPIQPQPKVKHDQGFDMSVEYFSDRFAFQIPARVSIAAPSGLHEVQATIRFQICNDLMCLPPQTRTVAAGIQIVDGGPETIPEESLGTPLVPALDPPVVPEISAVDDEPPPIIGQEALPSGTWAYLLAAMSMGAFALLTPCVFPMIPITVSYFTKREGVSRKQSVFEAALYSLGIILTFTALGFSVTLITGEAGGINRFAASPAVNLFVAAVFLILALNLFGLFEIRVPTGWVSALDKKSSTMGGVFGILLMSLTFSLTSFTCTVPFVGAVMVTALQGDWLWPLLGVAAFATVFSAPFFLLALFPSLLQALPKSGGWMLSVKVTMGFLELAAALKFISNVDLVYQWGLLTRPVFITVWLAIALVTAFYLLGIFRLPHETAPSSIGVVRMLSAVFFLSVSFYLIRGLFGFPLGEMDAFLPPRDYGEEAYSVPFLGAGNAPGEEWLDSYPAALEKSRLEQKPVFIDFTGYTCTNCRLMESKIFPLKEVQDLFSRYVLVRLYTDGNKPEHAKNQEFERERFGTIALPFYALMSPEERIIGTFPGFTRNSEKFVDFLRAGLRSHETEKGARGAVTARRKEPLPQS